MSTTILTVKDIDAAKAHPRARLGEARVAGVLRGGTFLDGHFYTCTGSGPIRVACGAVTGIHYHGFVVEMIYDGTDVVGVRARAANASDNADEVFETVKEAMKAARETCPSTGRVYDMREE